MFIDANIGEKFVRFSIENCLIICHGLPFEPGSVIDKSYYELANFFSKSYPTLIFDFSGTGKSGGKFSLKTWVEDLREVAEKFGEVSIIGYSMGGSVAIRASAELENVSKLVVVSSPCSSDIFTEESLRIIYQNAKSKGVLRGIGDFSFFYRSFLREFDEIEPLKWIGDVKTPKLIVHGTEDQIVPFHHFERLFKTAADPKMYLKVIGGDHFLRRNLKVQGMILSWLKGEMKESTEISL